ALMDAGAADEEKKTFRQVNLAQYLRQVPDRPADAPVAIVVAEGEIGEGQAPAGRVGGDSTSALIRKAREDDKVKALVLRVNSPGGSAFASEQIRRELELTRAAGKPVVVSMGDVAASGGYWIAMAADEVIAEPSTITGSIGVFGILPTRAFGQGAAATGCRPCPRAGLAEPGPGDGLGCRRRCTSRLAISGRGCSCGALAGRHRRDRRPGLAQRRGAGPAALCGCGSLLLRQRALSGPSQPV
ncbi:MAG: hypothetical protein EBV28_06935, partial [Betaproteobacteria bacterium]|nr:hypothetical protein [Betaproteobacteria bacterium]